MQKCCSTVMLGSGGYFPNVSSQQRPVVHIKCVIAVFLKLLCDTEITNINIYICVFTL